VSGIAPVMRKTQIIATVKMRTAMPIRIKIASIVLFVIVLTSKNKWKVYRENTLNLHFLKNYDIIFIE